MRSRCAGASSSAFARCKDPNNPNVLRQADGGYVELGQGWFYKAAVQQSSNWALAYCHYGDSGTPAQHPLYGQCKVSGKTVTCGRDAVIKQ